MTALAYLAGLGTGLALGLAALAYVVGRVLVAFLEEDFRKAIE